MNTRAPDQFAPRTRIKRRQAQSVGAGSWWARLISPPRGSMHRRAVTTLESVLATLLAIALCWLFRPHNPLLIHVGFGWIWIVPIVLALRYGSIAGAFSGLILLGAWYVLYPGADVSSIGSIAHSLLESPPGAQAFPVGFFFGGFVFTLLCGQFGDVWITRLGQARMANDYLAERLSILTRNQFLLRLSHERLEQDLLGRPATLRDSLARMRAVTISKEPAIAQRGVVDLRGAQQFLDTAAQACQLEGARLYAWRDGKPNADAAAWIGSAFDLEPDDPLVREALETRTLVHIESGAQESGAPSRYIACVPLVDAMKEPVGLLVIERMPFLALTRDNLQFLLVLCNYYADGVRHADVTRDMLEAFPDCPYEFALDYARLVHLYRDTRVRSSLVGLVFDGRDASTTWYEHVLRTRRALDVQWARGDGQHRTILTLMPLSGEGSIDGYLLRIEDNLRAQYGVDFESARIAVHTMVIADEEPVAALRRLLERCDARG
ncbi:PelD GGDEF domain-containing protein [Paraburkholderia sp. PREW-6R]|uniref:PelD GGDEF domain-containing protein n=1 Tax=Paraburkholderia sp. PREW-6R TaxID=3141544 RepID=UPI0031F50349